jgi:hypothetical protein
MTENLEIPGGNPINFPKRQNKTKITGFFPVNELHCYVRAPDTLHPRSKKAIPSRDSLYSYQLFN